MGKTIFEMLKNGIILTIGIIINGTASNSFISLEFCSFRYIFYFYDENVFASDMRYEKNI